MTLHTRTRAVIHRAARYTILVVLPEWFGANCSTPDCRYPDPYGTDASRGPPRCQAHRPLPAQRQDRRRAAMRRMGHRPTIRGGHDEGSSARQ